MDLNNEFQSIREWAHEKGIYVKGDVKTQALKLVEEVGELCKAILNEDVDEMKDGMGDCSVVLVNLAVLISIQYDSGITLESCINDVYKIISKRKGEMKNGTFVKNKTES